MMIKLNLLGTLEEVKTETISTTNSRCLVRRKIVLKIRHFQPLGDESTPPLPIPSNIHTRIISPSSRRARAPPSVILAPPARSWLSRKNKCFGHGERPRRRPMVDQSATMPPHTSPRAWIVIHKRTASSAASHRR